mgnify:CR=1 FL=1
MAALFIPRGQLDQKQRCEHSSTTAKQHPCVLGTPETHLVCRAGAKLGARYLQALACEGIRGQQSRGDGATPSAEAPRRAPRKLGTEARRRRQPGAGVACSSCRCDGICHAPAAPRNESATSTSVSASSGSPCRGMAQRAAGFYRGQTVYQETFCLRWACFAACHRITCCGRTGQGPGPTGSRLAFAHSGDPLLAGSPCVSRLRPGVLSEWVLSEWWGVSTRPLEGVFIGVNGNRILVKVVARSRIQEQGLFCVGSGRVPCSADARSVSLPSRGAVRARGHTHYCSKHMFARCNKISVVVGNSNSAVEETRRQTGGGCRQRAVTVRGSVRWTFSIFFRAILGDCPDAGFSGLCRVHGCRFGNHWTRGRRTGPCGGSYWRST